jgi:8-oxo-dGTP diphosphatase
MDVCDVYDSAGARTGRSTVRGIELAHGEYYLVVQVWIRNEAGEYLVQQRAAHLESGPGMWATTAGYVLSGEDSLAGAIREVSEELGVQLAPGCFSKFDCLYMDGLMQDIWLADVSKSAIGQLSLGSEVDDWAWASMAELERMVSRGEFFAYSYLGSLPR